MNSRKNAEEINEQRVATAETYHDNYDEEIKAMYRSRASHARFYATLPAPVTKKESRQQAMLRASSSNFQK